MLLNAHIIHRKRIIILFQSVFTFTVNTWRGMTVEICRFAAKFKTSIITVNVRYTLAIRIRSASRLGTQDTCITSIAWGTISTSCLFVSWKWSTFISYTPFLVQICFVKLSQHKFDYVWNVLMIMNHIPLHSPEMQNSVPVHSSSSPHLQIPDLQLSVLPELSALSEHLTLDPQWQ